MKSERRLLEKLPSPLKDNPFWATSHTKKPTTFGCESRSFCYLNEDDPYNAEKDIHRWEKVDKFGGNHGRLQISSTWGSLSKAPPAPCKYDPNHEKLSYRENFPSITFSVKSDDKEYFENLQRAQSFRAPVTSPTLGKKMRKSTKKKNNPSHGSDFGNVNFEDMRKALLPGPGSYNISIEESIKFERCPLPILPTKEQRISARPRLNFESLEIMDKTNEHTGRVFLSIFSFFFSLFFLCP
jgi:hypothetical protein